MQVSPKVSPFSCQTHIQTYINQGTASTICEFANTEKSANYRYRQKILNSHKICLQFCIRQSDQVKINFDNIRKWTLKTDGQNIEIKTEDNEADRESARRALLDFVTARHANPLPTPTSQAQATIPISQALSEYKVFQAKSTTALKTQKMGESVLDGLAKNLGGDFDMAQINDEVIESKWLEPRLEKVARTTAKRDLTFVRGFVNWASDKKRKYTPAPLTISLEATGESWSYLNSTDLKLIFTDLHQHAEKPWQLWIPILGLYTGARIAELASIKTGDVINKNGIDAVHLRGTKTDASDRVIPIHSDLIEMGFLEYATARQELKKEMLFDIQHSAQNGAGAQASKWYTAYKSKVGLRDRLKVFHSFRPTIVDHLKQASSPFEARCQYVGHDSGGGVHNKIYGRNELNLKIIKEEVVERIDWQTYCGWELNIENLKEKADLFTNEILNKTSKHKA